jgi:hypothetical protein
MCYIIEFQSSFRPAVLYTGIHCNLPGIDKKNVPSSFSWYHDKNVLACLWRVKGLMNHLYTSTT